MLKRGLLFIIALFICSNAIAQETVAVETDTHIFWHPDRKLTKDDFQGDGSSMTASASNCNEHGLCAVGFFGLWSKVDIPNKKLRKRGIREERIYIVPAFQKATSFILNADTLGIKHPQLIFDLVEATARMARHRLQEWQNAVDGATGMKGIMIETVMAEATEFREAFVASYYHDIFIKKDEAAYAEWRSAVDTILENYNGYATSEDEYNRFISKKPLVENYEESPSYIGDMRKKHNTTKAGIDKDIDNQ